MTLVPPAMERAHFPFTTNQTARTKAQILSPYATPRQVLQFPHRQYMPVALPQKCAGTSDTHGEIA